eukprot:1192494-Alexandrium_andersonii.AAC.1
MSTTLLQAAQDSQASLFLHGVRQERVSKCPPGLQTPAARTLRGRAGTRGYCTPGRERPPPTRLPFSQDS